VKKKYLASSKDKEDWINFTNQMGQISSKEADLSNKSINIHKLRKLDLHGLTLIEANKKVKNFLVESLNIGYKKTLIVTGKGSRSKTYENPYVSEKLSVLRYSVPEYIESDSELKRIVYKISEANKEDGGEGAIYVFLKNNKKIKE
jgi:DNA-nicking Smr family endonuclease